jgi:hypothetical protein
MPQFQLRPFAPFTPRSPIPNLKMPTFTNEKNTNPSQKFRENFAVQTEMIEWCSSKIAHCKSSTTSRRTS